MQFVSYENSILNPYSLDSLCSLHTIESMLWSLKITHICRITLHYFYLNRSNSHNSTAMSTSPSVITDLGRISAFNRGPLTSVFTPAATCLSTLTFIRDMYFGHQVTYPGNQGAYFDPACFPTSLSSSQTQQSNSDPWTLYYCMNC
jgi:hypothetical protein